MYTRKKTMKRKKIVHKKRIVRKKKEGFIAHALRLWYSGLKKEAQEKKAKVEREKKIKDFKRKQAFSRLKTNIKTFFNR